MPMPDARQAADPADPARATLPALHREHGFRELTDLLPVAIYITDAEGRLTNFNPACETLSGRTPQLGTDYWCVTWKMYHPDGTPMPHDACPMAVALREGRTLYGRQTMAERPDGTRIWFESYPVPLRDSEGKITGGLNLLVDITRQKQAEAEREQLLEREQQARREAEAIALDNARLFQEAQQEIAERERIAEALRVNSEELARFNKAAVGRELRMIDLKKEVNALCRKLGEALRYPLRFEKDAGARDDP